jgi:hypothetical protein
VNARRDAVGRDAALAARYARIADGGAAVLANGHVAPDPLPVDGGLRWGIAAVLRLRGRSPALTDAAAALARLLGPSHVVHAPDALHVTLRQFEPYRERIAADDARLHACAAVVASFAADTAPVTIALRGLIVSSTGVVVAGWPRVDLQRLRLDLHDRLDAAHVPMTGPEADRSRLRDTAHASLAIFGGPVARHVELAALAADHADADFGTCTFDDVSIVGYRRTHDAVSLIDHGAWRFAR